jgi:cytidylate kinase
VPVVTISRGSFSGGKMLAERLCEVLDYRCIDRDAVVEKAAAHGASQADLRQALDAPPGFWDRFNQKKYVYLTLIQAVLAEEVSAGRAVYHGNAGHLLLRGVSHVLRVRIIAPLEFRLAMVQDRLHLGRSEALSYVQRVDEDRRRWTRYLYGVDWGDPSLYDLVVNLEHLDLNEAVEVIATTARQRGFAETPDSLNAMNDLALASRVRATLAISPGTSSLQVEVEAHDGAVRVTTSSANAAQCRQVRALVEQLPGVSAVSVASGPDTP